MKNILDWLTGKRVKDLEYKVKQLEFMIKCPPKYKVGDIIKDGKNRWCVRGYEPFSLNMEGLFFNYRYHVINTKNYKETEFIISIFDKE